MTLNLAQSSILMSHFSCYSRRSFLKLPNIYDATVAKTSTIKLKFFHLFRHYVNLFNWWNYPETDFRGEVSKLGKKIKFAAVFTFSVKLEKWSFHVANLPRTGKKCTEIKKAREGREKLLSLFIKYAKFVALSLPSLRRSYTP